MNDSPREQEGFVSETAKLVVGSSGGMLGICCISMERVFADRYSCGLLRQKQSISHEI